MSRELTPQETAERSLIKKYRKELWNPFIAAVKRYELIVPGDRIAVCISGGKDSMVLAKLMQELQRHTEQPFQLTFLVMDPGYAPANRALIEENAARLGIPITVFRSDIFDVAYQVEKNPCYLCARMRRGFLYSKARELGCNKIALGHHFDDAVETFFLSLFYEGRLSCFQPVTYLDRTGITQIRPLLYCGEGMLRNAAERNHLPVVFNPCPADGNTKRQEVKELIKSLDKQYPGLKSRVFGAMQGLPLPAWGPVEHRRVPLPEGD